MNEYFVAWEKKTSTSAGFGRSVCVCVFLSLVPQKQVWVVGAELEPGVLSAGSSSFVVVDFFDFESQATPLLPGVSPAFDFATTFKVCSAGDSGE